MNQYPLSLGGKLDSVRGVSYSRATGSGEKSNQTGKVRRPLHPGPEYNGGGKSGLGTVGGGVRSCLE